MSVVGAFPLQDINRRTIAGPVNPLDKSTLVSIFPKNIQEVKPTLSPGQWDINAGSFENPSLTIIKPSSWWKDVGEDQPLIEIPVSSIQIAESLVKDYCNGYLGCDMTAAMPGIYYIPGEIVIERIKGEFKPLLINARIRQTNLYKALVKMADAFWARSNGNPLAISDDMRMAARELGIQGKDWMSDFLQQDVIRCVACGFMRNPEFPVCPNCKAVVDADKAKKLGLKFVE